VELTITGLAPGRVRVTQSRVDREHGNSYEKWKAMGSPQPPSPAQYRELEAASKLEVLGAPATHEVRDGKVILRTTLPRQGVSLLRLSP
jgi:xylan 1,4-beta-xylosidase